MSQVSLHQTSFQNQLSVINCHGSSNCWELSEGSELSEVSEERMQDDLFHINSGSEGIVNVPYVLEPGECKMR